MKSLWGGSRPKGRPWTDTQRWARSVGHQAALWPQRALKMWGAEGLLSLIQRSQAQGGHWEKAPGEWDWSELQGAGWLCSCDPWSSESAALCSPSSACVWDHGVVLWKQGFIWCCVIGGIVENNKRLLRLTDWCLYQWFPTRDTSAFAEVCVEGLWSCEKIEITVGLRNISTYSFKPNPRTVCGGM